MGARAPRHATLEAWLRWQETLHPRAVELGLERVSSVWRALGAPRPAPLVVTVAGTNGKGSVVAFLESVLGAARWRTAAYTSPHLARYNERVRIAGEPVPDEALVEAFAAVDAARGGTTLTYFEFGTLAALWLLARAEVDVALLEVGLGGRLDAVNVVDPDVAVITQVGLDHTEWLGPDREAIGREKAGILRPGRPAVVGDPAPPAAVEAHARELGARLVRRGREFDLRPAGEGQWAFEDAEGTLILPTPGLAGPHQLDNAATAVAAAQLAARAAGRLLPSGAIARGVREARLAGRFQRIAGEVETVLDVAHNPDAAAALRACLEAAPARGATRCVLGMMADKDVEGFVRALAPAVSAWHAAGLPGPRGLEGGALERRVRAAGVEAVEAHEDVTAALAAARAASAPGDRVLVTGSFLTVAAVLA
ncbi:MAG TPA: bifunctional tetrahydrofolate synthase/dihydrofolate synthase [Chromatiales bacterium]|nr:bifunctional tetrahydrofolate synthase/dihydrofolate synthase [Chromatiales bacterium]